MTSVKHVVGGEVYSIPRGVWNLINDSNPSRVDVLVLSFPYYSEGQFRRVLGFQHELYGNYREEVLADIPDEC